MGRKGLKYWKKSNLLICKSSWENRKCDCIFSGTSTNELFFEKCNSRWLWIKRKCWSFLMQYSMFTFHFFSRTTWTALKASVYGLQFFLAKFLRWCRMYDSYRAAIIWVCVLIFVESKFRSPFRRKIYLPNCHATSVYFIWPTKLFF